MPFINFSPTRRKKAKRAFYEWRRGYRRDTTNGENAILAVAAAPDSFTLRKPTAIEEEIRKSRCHEARAVEESNQLREQLFEARSQAARKEAETAALKAENIMLKAKVVQLEALLDEHGDPAWVFPKGQRVDNDLQLARQQLKALETELQVARTQCSESRCSDIPPYELACILIRGIDSDKESDADGE